MSISPVIQRRLETQGYICSSAPKFVKIEPWLRFSPAICTVVVFQAGLAWSGYLLGGILTNPMCEFSPKARDF